jgi:ubiquinone/menaquinone biosynthesis C-methylase UbiE
MQASRADVITSRGCFARDYELGRSAAMRDLERSVLGCDYGGTSWTTRREAGRIAELLGLRPGVRLLDVGAGAGWPGLYLAQVTGCDVVLADLPVVGLQTALERAAADGLEERCRVVVTDGAALPFGESSFDAVSHSDVLCCMPAKLAMLQACQRVACTGARMVFSVIAPAASLSESERQLAIESGPPFVDVARDYSLLLEESGWRVQERIDVTIEFAQSIRTWLGGMKISAEALSKVLGVDEFAERVMRKQATLAAIDRGLLKREIFAAIAATSPQTRAACLRSSPARHVEVGRQERVARAQCTSSSRRARRRFRFEEPAR